jgi:hypothetical protein
MDYSILDVSVGVGNEYLGVLRLPTVSALGLSEILYKLLLRLLRFA